MDVSCPRPLPSSCSSLSPRALGNASPEEEFGGEGLVLKVLCVRHQLRAVNSAWFCSEKVQSCHWQHLSIKARAGNLLAQRAVLLGSRSCGRKVSLWSTPTAGGGKAREQHSGFPELFVLIVRFWFPAALVGWDLLMKDGHSPLLFV